MKSTTLDPNRSGSLRDEAAGVDCLAGGGNMGALMRSFDWSATPLGPVETWPQSLRTAVSIMLASGFPMLVLWGDEYIQLYNDAYRPVLGATKHPAALGQRGRDCWPEIWEQVLGPMFGAVMAGGEPIWSEDLLFVLDRNGYLEETFFTFSYSAIRDETGRPGGVLVTCVETTARVLGERRLRTLRELASHASTSQTVEETCRKVAQTLAANVDDLPFALIYRTDGATTARLCAATRLDAGGTAVPATLNLDDGSDAAWPVGQVVRDGRAQMLARLGERLGPLPGGRWPEPADAAVVLPITSSGQTPAIGALVAGVSPRRELDADYRTFLELVAAQIGTAINAARAYEAERERAEALAEIDRAKTAFFSNISHEFRTPLTLMLAPTERALASPARSLGGEDLETVHRNQRRLLKLVNALLDFSRIEAGRANASYDPVDLPVLTSDLASAFRSAIERAGVRYEVHCPPLGEPVYVDRHMWEQIVLNLLSNAFKFTFEGTIRVELSRSGDRVALSVSDTGVGIPEHELSRVFERFHRVEGTQGRTHEGSGIGLALVQDLVRLHGGEVRVASRIGEGTTFTIFIPTGPAHLPADRVNRTPHASTPAMGADTYVAEAMRWVPTSAPPEPGIDSPAADGGTLASAAARILVVDDNADMRDYLQRVLSAHWSVETAADGTAALEIASARRPDLVVADLMMPGLDGFGLIRALRADPRTATIPVVVLSARAGEEARLEGHQHGADDYLVKPFSARELLVRINAQLAVAEHRRERETLLRREEAARREALLQKEHLELLFTHFPSPICILRGADYVIELANQAACEMWARRSEEVLDRPLFEALPEVRDQGLRDLLDGVLRTGVPYIGREREVLLNRGGTSLDKVYLNFVYAPMRDIAGTIEGVLVVATDVTPQVLARQDLAELRERAETANRAKDQFLAMLGHELRNPLAPILTALQLMSLRGDDSASRERAVIDRQVRHLVRLVDDLLDVSRIARGRIELRKERVELADVVARAIEMSSPLLEERHINLKVSVPRTGLVLHGDVTRLAQVVMNLLTNAAKYTEPRGRVEIRGRRQNGTIELAVRDSGTGIPREMLARIFDLFVQGSQTIERSQGGLGLGLTIVRSLVELHGGRVEARSDGVGCGSEFLIRLPAFEVAPEGSTRTRRRSRLSAKRRVRVLVVDDNRDAGQMIAEALDMMGYEAHVAVDGPAALQAAQQFEPDIALLDIGLPVMDGYELAQHLRASYKSRPLTLVAVTGYGQESDRERSLEAGFHTHIVKPVDLQLLNRVLDEIAAAAPKG